MKINYDWLNEWVEIKSDAYELANTLDLLGIEVEEIDETSGDIIYSLDINPNRPDLLSVWGIAREISAKTGNTIKKDIDFTTYESKKKKEEFDLSVDIENNEDCPRYIATIVTDLEIKDSPQFIKDRLRKCGIRPLNNVIDITNYVLLETGHPLHAFDYDMIEDRIVVRRAKRGELIQTLEGEQRELTENDLVIADIKKPIALAGIMGGKNSGITEKSKTVVIESAFFKPSIIRRTSRRMKLITESSYRFERKADIEMLKDASLYTVELLEKHAGAKYTGTMIDTNPSPDRTTRVTFSYDSACQILGKRIGEDEINEIFSRLGFQKEETDKENKLDVIIPSYRRDIEIEEDLIEEIGRFIGYDNIPTRFSFTSNKISSSEERELWDIRRVLVSLGLHEAVNIPFIEPSWARIRNEESIELRNPMWSNKNIMRNTLIPGLIECCERNLNSGEETVSLFEIGRTFKKDKNELKNMAGVLSGKTPLRWYEKQRDIDFYDIKGIIEGIMEKLQVQNYRYIECRDNLFEKARALTVTSGDNTIGSFGLLSGKYTNTDIYGFEFNVEKLKSISRDRMKYSESHRYPPVKRDLSIVTDSQISYREVMKIIEQSVTHEVRIGLMDVYRGESIETNKKSLTFRIEFYHREKTLKEAEVEKDIDSIIQNLSDIGAYLRD